MLESFGRYMIAETAAPHHWLLETIVAKRIYPIFYTQLVGNEQPVIRHARATFDAGEVGAVPTGTNQLRMAVVVMLRRHRTVAPLPREQIPADEMTSQSLDGDDVLSAVADIEQQQNEGFCWLRTAQYVLADVLTTVLLELTLIDPKTRWNLAQSFAGKLPADWAKVAVVEAEGSWLNPLGPMSDVIGRIAARQRKVMLLADTEPRVELMAKHATLLVGGAHIWRDADRAIIRGALAPEQQRLVALWAHTFATWIHDVPTGNKWMNEFEGLLSSPLAPTLRDIFPHLLLTELRIETGDRAGEFTSRLPSGRPLNPQRLTQWVYITTPADLRHVWYPGARTEAENDTRLNTNDRATDALYRRIEAAVGIHNHEAI